MSHIGMRSFYRFLLFAILVGGVIAHPAAQTQADHSRQHPCFGETQQCIDSVFSAYWQQNGGLSVFGYPITPKQWQLNNNMPSVSSEDGGYATQWFERNRFEDHPENQPPYHVLLGRLGDVRLREQGRDWQTFPKASPSAPHYFPETGHAIAEVFWGYWSSHGLDFGDPGVSFRESLALFGFPLSEPAMETNSSGDTVLTQWFERARFEHHPNNPALYQVLLGLLGNEIVSNNKSQPAGVVVLNNYTSWPTVTNDRQVFGEVQNNTGQTIKALSIGTKWGSEYTGFWAGLDILKPGQRAAFSVAALGSDGPIDFKITWIATQEQPVEGLQVSDVTLSSTGASKILSGKVINTSGHMVLNPNVSGTLYNDQNQVVNYQGRMQLRDGNGVVASLGPGQEASFTLSFQDQAACPLCWNGASRYEIQPQGRQP